MTMMAEGMADAVQRNCDHRRTPPSRLAEAGDFFALLKPRVMSLVVFTALVGMVVAPGHLHPVLGLRVACSPSRSARAPRARSTCGTTPTSTR